MWMLLATGKPQCKFCIIANESPTRVCFLISHLDSFSLCSAQHYTTSQKGDRPISLSLETLVKIEYCFKSLSSLSWWPVTIYRFFFGWLHGDPQRFGACLEVSEFLRSGEGFPIGVQSSDRICKYPHSMYLQIMIFCQCYINHMITFPLLQNPITI